MKYTELYMYYFFISIGQVYFVEEYIPRDSWSNGVCLCVYMHVCVCIYHMYIYVSWQNKQLIYRMLVISTLLNRTIMVNMNSAEK